MQSKRRRYGRVASKGERESRSSPVCRELVTALDCLRYSASVSTCGEHSDHCTHAVLTTSLQECFLGSAFTLWSTQGTSLRRRRDDSILSASRGTGLLVRVSAVLEGCLGGPFTKLSL